MTSDLPKFDEIVAVGSKLLLDNPIFAMTFLLGRYCNYDCSYCWVFARSNVKDHRPTIQITNTLDQVKLQARANGFTGFSITLSGGEPILHPGFLEIMQHLADDSANCSSQHIQITSNISQGPRWWEQFVKHIDGLKVTITASWHREAGAKDPEAHRRKFADKILYLMSNHIWLTANIVMVPESWDQLYQDAVYLSERGVNVCLKPQSDKHGMAVVEGYTDEMQRLMLTAFSDQGVSNPYIITTRDGQQHFIDDPERINVGGFKSFTGWTCTTGFQGIVIREPGGIVSRAFSCQDEPLGTIDDGFTLFPTVRKCISSFCRTSFDTKFPKTLT